MAENKNKKSLEEKIKDLRIPISKSLLDYLKIQYPKELGVFIDLLSQCTARNINLSKIDTPEEWLEKFSNNRNLQTEFLKKKKYLPANKYERLDRLSEVIKKKYSHVPNIFTKEAKVKEKEEVKEKEAPKELKKKEDITKIENIIKKNLKKYSQTKDPKILKDLQRFQKDIKEIVPKLKNKKDIARLQSLSQEIKNSIAVKVGISGGVSTKASTEKPKKEKEILNVTQISKIPGILIEQNKDGSLNNISFNVEEINKFSSEDKEKILQLSLKDISNSTNKDINVDTPIFIKTDNNEIKLNPDFQNEMVKLHEYEVTAHNNQISLIPYQPTKIQLGKTKKTPLIPTPKKEEKEKTAKLKVKKEIKVPIEKKPKKIEEKKKPEEKVSKTKKPIMPPVSEIPGEVKEPEIPVQLSTPKLEVPITEKVAPITPEIKVPEEKAPTPKPKTGPVEEIKAPQKGITLVPHILPYTAPTKKYFAKEIKVPEEMVPPPPIEVEMPEKYIEEQVKKTQPPAPTEPTKKYTAPEEEGEITPEQRELEEKKEKKEITEKKKETALETAEEEAKKQGKKEVKKQIKKELIALLLENPYVLVILFAIIIIFVVIVMTFASTAVEEELRESRAICQNEPDKISPEKCTEVETEFKELELGKEGSECTINAHCETDFTCVDGICKSGETPTP